MYCSTPQEFYINRGASKNKLQRKMVHLSRTVKIKLKTRHRRARFGAQKLS